MTETMDVPELREVVLAHARVRQVEKVRTEAGDALALAVYEASKIATASLIARSIGVTRPRVSVLIEKGRLVAGDDPPKKKKQAARRKRL